MLGRASTLSLKVLHDIFGLDLKCKLNNNQSSPNAISHKQLKLLLQKAKKEMPSIGYPEIQEINENQDFNDLITNWTETSQQILLKLNKKDQVISKNTNPKSLLAFGAMGAHINMALQALKATELDQ